MMKVGSIKDVENNEILRKLGEQSKNHHFSFLFGLRRRTNEIRSIR
jgi:hypothetical protein